GTNPLAKEFYFERNFSMLLLTGIANTKPLEYYLKNKAKNIVPVKYKDHHHFTKADIGNIQKIFDNIAAANKIILTTEKDAMRLKSAEYTEAIKNLPLFYIPIEIDFHNKEKNTRLNDTVGQEFNEQILHYVRANQKHSSIHSK
ncbi:MAG: tetraacyldisaccharide 4'-kinase, partial [Bacteroidetes bacterium]|nr:tetraacyldisaccharide 4'-kinase [Bacteroidota bacterium]